MKKPSYSERRWRPIRWWEVASCTDPSEMPFLRHFPEPAAVLVARILAQARGLMAPEKPSPRGVAQAVTDPWEDGGLAGAWFASGDRDANRQPKTTQADHQGGPHA